MAHDIKNLYQIKRFVYTCMISFFTAATMAQLTTEEITYHRENSKTPAIEIDTQYYTATLVPELGGRILRLVDKKTGTELAYDNGYGGLLDDHDGRINTPYSAEWLEKTPERAVVKLICDDEVKYTKTVTFHAARPAIEVEYHIENHSQAEIRLLFRNVLRPGGQPFTDEEIYCYSLVTGLQRAYRMPRTDNQAAPWCALVHTPTKMAIANTFEGDILARLYTWRGSLVAPTYEFMFHPLKAGHQIKARYAWTFGHGLDALDYAHRGFMAQLEGDWDGEKLNAKMDLIATWQKMPGLNIKAEILDSNRKILSETSHDVALDELDQVVNVGLSQPVATEDDYIILQLTASDPALGAEPIVFEKPFARGGDAKLLAQYSQPIRWVGADVPQTPIAGWQEERLYTAQPDAADQKRGYMVFEEVGKNSGVHTTTVSFQMAQNEPESFPLRMLSLDKSARVKIESTAPAGMTLETFIPEAVPNTNWGRVFLGYKMLEGNQFEIAPGDDRLVYFRLNTQEANPGLHRGKIKFNVEGAEPTEVAVEANVHPVRFPYSLYLSFDVNNSANQLAATKIKGIDYEWDAEKAHNFFTDMSTHGVRGQKLGSITAPNAHYWYNRVKVRDTGQPLIDAIKADPERFQQLERLPDLDFGEWDWFMDIMLQYGQSHVRIGLGLENFAQGHNRITKQIYGQELPTGDLRQMFVMEWYNSQLVRYLKDRGLARVMATIGDEIPGEKLAWWVQHAFRSIQMGLEPGVTQSVALLSDSTKMNMVAPFMKYWIIGSFNKEIWDKRRVEGLVRPEHWKTTYHSSANHWQPYYNTRAICGLNSAFFDLDACWIQTYDRFWSMGQTVLYLRPDGKGPISSVAWEGARDGLDDGNMLLLARAMRDGLPTKSQRQQYSERIEEIVGMRDDSLVRFINKYGQSGIMTVMERYDTENFRQAKARLLDLIGEMVAIAPVQKAGANHGIRELIRDGAATYLIPDELPMADKAERFLAKVAQPLQYEAAPRMTGEAGLLRPVFFVGTRAQLAERLPELAELEALADLSENYPSQGEYVVRYVTPPTPPVKRGETPIVPAESLLVIVGDEAGADKGLGNLANVITTPRYLYSHWLPQHWK